MHTLTLTPQELNLVLVALAAISPSGGGSKPYTLLRGLVASQGVGMPDDLEVFKAQLTAGQEANSED